MRHNTGAAVVLIGRGNQEDNLSRESKAKIAEAIKAILKQQQSSTLEIENNEIILKVNFTTYQGKVEVIDDVSSIKYYFIEENTTIEKKLIKK